MRSAIAFGAGALAGAMLTACCFAAGAYGVLR
jgi:hypothetical protein